MLFQHILDEVSLANVVASIREYEDKEVHRIRRYYDYYNGKQDILNKTVTEGRSNQRIVDNKLRAIADTYTGFINPGQLDTTSDFYEEFSEEILDAVRDAVIVGVGYTLCYYDTKLCLKRVKPTGAMVFRDNSITHNVIGGAFWSRYNVIEDSYTKEYVELYIVDESYFYYYKGPTLEGLVLQESWSHNIPGVPIREYRCTSHYDSIIEPGMGLQDLVNITLSSYADGRSDFSDPFLMITGIGISDESGQQLLDGDRKILNLPLADARAEYLIKPDSGTDLVTLLTDIDTRLYKACNCPDFSDQKYSSASGAALISKCISFTNACNTYRACLGDAIDYVASISGGWTWEWPSYWDALQEADTAVDVVRNEAGDVASAPEQ